MPDRPQQADQRIGLIDLHSLALPHPPVEKQKSGDVHLASQQSLAHKQQVVIALPGAAVEEELRSRVDPPAAACAGSGWCGRLLGQGAAQPLCQVGMAACPVEHALEQRLRLRVSAARQARHRADR